MFFNDQDYRAFEQILQHALEQRPTRLLSYAVMPNHWHLVLWAIGNEVPTFMHRLTRSHAVEWHRSQGTAGTGHVYQERYRAIPVQTDTHLLTLLRYVERNPLRAGLVERAEQWRWGSLWRRCHVSQDGLLSAWPVAPPANWVELVNSPQTQEEVEAVQKAVKENRPLGETKWSEAAAMQVRLERRPIGRPRKSNQV
jgi:putative transposase